MASTLFTKQQAEALRHYDSGAFSHLLDCKDAGSLHAQLLDCGDGLLRYVMSDLSAHEGCSDTETALSRLRRASTVLGMIADTMEVALAPR